jgi:hypothetical protein
MKLGDVVRDKISGFSGVATCRLDYLNGCERWRLACSTRESRSTGSTSTWSSWNPWTSRQ